MSTMKDKEDKDQSADQSPELTPLEIIRKCGRQQLPPDRIILILCERLSHPAELIQVKANISIPGTPEHTAYASGWAQGEMELGDALLSNAIGAEKDGYKSLSQERTRQSVNRILEKNFGLSDS